MKIFVKKTSAVTAFRHKSSLSLRYFCKQIPTGNRSPHNRNKIPEKCQ